MQVINCKYWSGLVLEKQTSQKEQMKLLLTSHFGGGWATRRGVEDSPPAPQSSPAKYPPSVWKPCPDMILTPGDELVYSQPIPLHVQWGLKCELIPGFKNHTRSGLPLDNCAVITKQAESVPSEQAYLEKAYLVTATI